MAPATFCGLSKPSHGRASAPLPGIIHPTSAAGKHTETRRLPHATPSFYKLQPTAPGVSFPDTLSSFSPRDPSSPPAFAPDFHALHCVFCVFFLQISPQHLADLSNSPKSAECSPSLRAPIPSWCPKSPRYTQQARAGPFGSRPTPPHMPASHSSLIHHLHRQENRSMGASGPLGFRGTVTPHMRPAQIGFCEHEHADGRA